MIVVLKAGERNEHCDNNEENNTCRKCHYVLSTDRHAHLRRDGEEERGRDGGLICDDFINSSYVEGYVEMRTKICRR